MVGTTHLEDIDRVLVFHDRGDGDLGGHLPRRERDVGVGGVLAVHDQQPGADEAGCPVGVGAIDLARDHRHTLQ